MDGYGSPASAGRVRGGTAATVVLLAVVACALCLVCACSGAQEREGGASAGGSAAASEVVDPTVEAPYGVKVYSITDEGIELYWKRPEDVDGYAVYRSYEKGGDYENISGVDEYSADGVIADRSAYQFFDTAFDHERRTVYYRVRAYRDSGGVRMFSEPSEVMTARYRTSLKLGLSSAHMFSGTSRVIGAYYGWGDATGVEWSSDAPETVAVSADGEVSALSAGEATVTCRSDGLGQQAELTVVVDRADDPMLAGASPRYTPGADGVYRSARPGAEGEATIMMAGDLMALSPTIKACRTADGGYDFNACYDYVKPVLQECDLAIGNLETMVASEFSYSDEEPYINRKPVANAPSEYLDAVAYGGFDVLTMSNNHNADCGTRGVLSTLDAVERYGFPHTGLFSGTGDARYLVLDVNGIRVGIAAYTHSQTGFNGKDHDWDPEDVEGMLNYYTREKAEADLAGMRAAGAEYCIAYLHWGVKNYFTVTDAQLTAAQEVADIGFDYIAGGHSHTVQRYADVTAADGRVVPCIFSMGDFNSHINQIPGNRDSVLMRVKLQRADDGSVTLVENGYIPFYTYTKHKGNPYVTIPLDAGWNGGVGNLKNQGKFLKRIASEVGDQLEACRYRSRS